MDGACDLLQPEAVRHRKRDLRDHVTGVARHDGRTDNLIFPLPHVDFYEPLVLAFEDGSVDFLELLDECVDLDTFLLRILLVQPHVCYLRGRISTPRNRQRAGFGASLEESVLDDDPRHEVGCVCKLVGRTDVPGSVNAGICRLQPVVDLDAALVVRDTHAFEVEAFHVGSSTHTDQELVDGLVVAFSVRVERESNRTRIVYYLRLAAATKELYSVPQKRVLDDLGRWAIFARQNTVFRFHEVNLRAEPGERLRQFAADGPGSDDAQSSWELRQGKDGFVCQVLDAIQPRNGRSGRPSSSRYDGLLEAESRVADLDRIPSGELALAKEHVDTEVAKTRCRIVRADRRTQPPHSLHGRPEVHSDPVRHVDTEVLGVANSRSDSSRADHAFGGNAAYVEAIASH